MPNVKLDGDFHGNESNRWLALIERHLLPVVRRDIRVSYPHWKTRQPKLDGNFNIYFWSSPRRHGRVYDIRDDYHMARLPVPAQLYGVNTECRDHAFFPTGEGFTFRDPTGFPVAQILGSERYPYCELYILYDIAHFGRVSEITIGNILFEQVANFLKLYKQDLGLFNHWLEQDRVQVATQLAACLSPINFQQGNNWSAELADASSKLREQSTLHALSAVLGMQQFDFSRVLARYQGEIEKIEQHPAFDHFVIQPSSEIIEIHCKPLICTYSNTRRMIGRMSVVINLSDFSVMLWNLDGMVNFSAQDRAAIRLNAPGVDEHGKLFDKSLLPLFASLIGKGQLHQTFSLAVNFVQQLNQEADWAENATLWPEVSQ